MKKLIIIITIVLALGACTKSKTHYQTTYHLVDQTDSNDLVDEITSHWMAEVSVPRDVYTGSTAILKSISDKKHTPEKSISLSAIDDPLSFNEFERKREIDTFKSRIEKELYTAVSQQSVGAEQSLVFHALSTTINEALKCTSDQIDIYVFSDLRNKSEEYDSYDPDDFGLLKYDQDSLTRLMDTHFAIQVVSTYTQPDITLHFLYQPRSAQDDFVFDRLVNFLEKYYSSKGLKVTIGSSLITATP